MGGTLKVARVEVNAHQPALGWRVNVNFIGLAGLHKQ